MFSLDKKELLGSSALAVILCGNSLSHYKNAMELFYKFGVVSILCKPKKNPLDIINLKCGFLQLDFKSNPRISCEKLLDLATEQSEYILILISQSSECDRFMCEFSNELECRYICVDSSKDINSLPLFSSQTYAAEEN